MTVRISSPAASAAAFALLARHGLLGIVARLALHDAKHVEETRDAIRRLRAFDIQSFTASTSSFRRSS